MNKETKEYLQMLFNLGWQKFVKERAPKAFEPAKGCRYLTSTGAKCLIGLTIPDGHPAQYAPGSVRTIWQVYPDLAPDNVDAVIIVAAQAQLHDDLDLGIPREDLYRTFADLYDLTIPQET